MSKDFNPFKPRAMQLDPLRIPPHLRVAARREPFETFTLPSGAKFKFKKDPEEGPYWEGWGYGDQRDILPFAVAEERAGLFHAAIFRRDGKVRVYLGTPMVFNVWPQVGNLYKGCTNQVLDRWMSRAGNDGPITLFEGEYIGFVDAKCPTVGIGYPPFEEANSKLEAERAFCFECEIADYLGVRRPSREPKLALA